MRRLLNETEDTESLTVTLAKGGQKTLAELDRYRYVDAPQSFSLQSAGKVMGLDDVKSLVEWKL